MPPAITMRGVASAPRMLAGPRIASQTAAATMRNIAPVTANRIQETTVSAENSAEQTAAATHRVVLNAEEQYSLWPADLDTPGGWKETGVCASKEECDRYLEETWTDMRPKSLRVQMQAAGLN